MIKIYYTLEKDNKMETLYKKKKTRSLYFFIFITLVPVIGVLVIFSYAFAHINYKIDFVDHELRGLSVITQIEKIVFDIQKIRGLSCISSPNEKSIKDITYLENNISNNLTSLKQKLLFDEEDSPLKNELLQCIDIAQKTFIQERNYENLTNIINEFMSFSNRIAYQCKLILDSDLSSHVLIDNVVYLLPELIEYSGQIRAIASSINGSSLTQTQKEQIVIQQDKIKERLRRLDYNKLFMYEKEDRDMLDESHKNIIDTQNRVMEFVKNRLLKNKIVAYESNDIFAFITDDINLMINLYHSNLNLLNKNLERKIKKDKEFSTFVFFTGLVFVTFIIFINRIFYLKNREYINKIEELTIIDAMTGLHNRRHFDETFENNLKIQQRTKQTLIFIMSDIDFFKLYNDTYGHQAGDIAIKTVADKLKSALRRAGDMAFRLGGEEFGILCTGMSEEEAIDFANAIRKEIENKKIEHKKNYISKYLTVSMGLIVVKPNIINSTNEIYRCADKALYKAKEGGRNRVVVYNSKTFC